MCYALLIHNDPAIARSLTEEDRQRLVPEWQALTKLPGFV